MAGHDLVECVQKCRRANGAEEAGKGTGQPELREELDAPAAVAGNRRPVAEDEPPALAAGVLRDRREQTVGLLSRERKQGELLVTVEPGDDTRRPTAEASVARVEEHRPAKV